MRLIKQLLFGWDTIIGLSAYVVLSIIFGEHFNVLALVFAGFWAYAPDIDLVPFALLKRRLEITVGHWVFGHYPVLVVPTGIILTLVVGALVWPEHELFLLALVPVCTVGHFLHDCAQPGGFHIFAPITCNGRWQFTLRDPEIWNHYRLSWSGFKLADQADTARMYEKAREMALGAGVGEIEGRLEEVGPTQYRIASVLYCAVFAMWALNGFRLV